MLPNKEVNPAWNKKDNTKKQNTKKIQNTKIQKENKETLLYVGDSVAHTTDFKYLQRKTKLEIRHVKAYSANFVLGEEKCYWPEKNVEDVVEKEMKKENFDYLVIGHSTVDITNLKVEDISEKHMEHNKRIVLNSAHSIFNTVTKVLETNKTLKKIVLLKPTPRYDPKINDPYGLKAHLSKLVSNTYEEARENSVYKDKINLGEHSRNFEKQHLHHEIYGNPHWRNYDGFHLRGCQGRIEMTQSLLKIFMDAGMLKEKREEHEEGKRKERVEAHEEQKGKETVEAHEEGKGKREEIKGGANCNEGVEDAECAEDEGKGRGARCNEGEGKGRGMYLVEKL